MNGRRLYALGIIALGIVALGIYGCTLPQSAMLGTFPNATSTVFLTPTPTFLTPTPTSPNALGVLGTVYIREMPDGTIVGYVVDGVYPGECSGNWCKIAAGYIWRGCTDNNPNELGCSSQR